MDLQGLTEGSRIAPATLGHRGSRMVVDVSHLVRSVVDERSHLPFCAVGEVFEPGAVFLGFGTPNVFLMLPRQDKSGWDKFAAFMFYRKPSYVAKKMDRMQLGFYFELRGLPNEAIESLRREMQAHQGRRTASCANANARVLAQAGFTCGGESLESIYRPSHLAAVIWANGGLEYKGLYIPIRPFQAGHEVGDHFVAVWWKEFTSACRSVKKKFSRKDTSSGAAPQFEEPQRAVGMSVERWEKNEERATIGVSRPSRLGVWLGFVLGQRPIFSLDPESPLEIPGLDEPLRPFPGKLDRVTKFKKHVLFSRPAVAFLRRHLMKSVDLHKDVPVRAVVDMLRLSPGPERETAFAYNLVVTKKAIRITRLENRNGRDKKFINWVMSKHLVVSGYDEEVVFAGEVWAYLNDDEVVVCLNRNSGTFQPEEEALEQMSGVITQLFDVDTETVEL